MSPFEGRGLVKPTLFVILIAYSVWELNHFLSRSQSTMAPVDLAKVGENFVKKVPSLDQVKLATLWADNTVVITFLRRFG